MSVPGDFASKDASYKNSLHGNGPVPNDANIAELKFQVKRALLQTKPCYPKNSTSCYISSTTITRRFQLFHHQPFLNNAKGV